jgi:hypothetical protein
MGTPREYAVAVETRVSAAIRYVVDEQGEPMAVFEADA